MRSRAQDEKSEKTAVHEHPTLAGYSLSPIGLDLIFSSQRL